MFSQHILYNCSISAVLESKSYYVLYGYVWFIVIRDMREM